MSQPHTRRLRAHVDLTWDARQYYISSRWLRRQREQATPLWCAFVEVMRDEQAQDALLAEAQRLVQPKTKS